MLTLLCGLALAAAPDTPPAHANPLYQELLETGVAVGADQRAKLPPPTMSDGLDTARQQAIIREVIGTDYSFEEFTRKSVVAPQVLKIRNVTPSDPNAPARGVDAWFVAYGTLDALDDEAFRDRLLRAGRESNENSQGGSLTAADLAARAITVPKASEGRERYGHIAFDFLDRVRLKATGRVVWSRTAESAVVAAAIDPRFAGDKQFPNQWQPLTREGAGLAAGPASPWSGGAFYLKITELKEPAGALFVEQHIVFAEPTGWFGGANLLRSKLPPAVQTIVRRMRREWTASK